jgi:hypothetical protein
VTDAHDPHADDSLRPFLSGRAGDVLVDDVDDEDDSAVRPYAITGGRTGHGVDINFETIVVATDHARRTDGTEHAERGAILRLVRHEPLSAAEIAVHLALPIGVARVLVADLVADGLLSRSGASGLGDVAPEDDIDLIVAVMEGINAL